MSRRLPLVAAVAWLFASAAAGQVAGPAERLLAEARQKAEAGELDAALIDWRAVVSQFGDTRAAIAARLAIGHASLELGDWEQAAASAQQVIDLAPRSAEASNAYLILGEAKLGTGAGDAERAAETFALAWDLFPGGREAGGRSAGRVREGEVRLRLGQPATAEKAFLDVVESQAMDVWVSRAYRGLARSRAARADWEAAIEALQEGMTRAHEAADGDPAVAGELAAMRRLAAAGHRLRLQAEGELPWSRSSLVSFKRPVAVAASADGRVVVVDRGLDEVLVMNADGLVERRTWRQAGRPFWAGEDDWWVPVGATLQSTGDVAPAVVSGADYKAVTAGAPAGFGAVLLTARPDAVVRTSSSFEVEDTIGLPARAEIVDLDTDPLGRVVMLDRRNGTLWRADDDGVDELASGLDKPSAVAVGPFGYIFVLENGERVTILDPEGQRVVSAGPDLGGHVLKGAEDLTVDESGRLWVADPRSDAVLFFE